MTDEESVVSDDNNEAGREDLCEAARLLREHHPDALIDVQTAFGEETLLVHRDHSYTALAFLRDDPALQYHFLVDVTAVDRLYLDEDIRFAVVYHLYSFHTNSRLRVKAPVAESDCHIASVSSLWSTANWLEREVYDMYGITFDNHPDLRRILMPDDFGSFPLRKDYPVHGKGERDNFVF